MYEYSLLIVINFDGFRIIEARVTPIEAVPLLST